MKKEQSGFIAEKKPVMLHEVSIGFPEKVVQRRLNRVFSFGKSYALMGRSGCGKTTLLRTIAGLQPTVAGTITGMEGRKIAFLFQEDRLLPWLTAFDNVAIASNAEKAAYWLEQMEIPDTAQYPRQMSGGMQRRVAIARAMALGGDVLILDEPFKGLDIALRERIAARIKDIYPLVLLSIHDEAEADLMHAEIIRLP